MRPLIIAVAAAALLAGCNRTKTADANAVVDQPVGTENIVTNDVTSIDAAFADAANMAADEPVDAVENDLNASADSSARPSGAKPAKKPAIHRSSTAATGSGGNSAAPATPAPAAPAPAPPAAGNTTG